MREENNKKKRKTSKLLIVSLTLIILGIVISYINENLGSDLVAYGALVFLLIPAIALFQRLGKRLKNKYYK
jgi:hypothetical protein